jgi:hypothetical protein
MPEFFGSAKALPFRKLPFHRSLIAIRYSPLAIRRLFGSAGTLPSHSTLVPFRSRLNVTCPVLLVPLTN